MDLVADAARRAAPGRARTIIAGDDTPRPEASRHSEAFLNDLRDGWWNADFLHLVARRLSLDTVLDALDVGAGHGHWTRVVAGMLSPGTRVVGVEREPDWVAEANRRARSSPRERMASLRGAPG